MKAACIICSKCNTSFHFYFLQGYSGERLVWKECGSYKSMRLFHLQAGVRQERIRTSYRVTIAVRWDPACCLLPPPLQFTAASSRIRPLRRPAYPFLQHLLTFLQHLLMGIDKKKRRKSAGAAAE